MKKPKRAGEGKSMMTQLNFWLITLAVVIAGYMAGECLIWARGGL